ncbi:MAG: nucleotidyltransferase family protein [Nitrospirae bacterium]|nr:nucleotidyltransferase family protein [Nitrospirota bacterium]
MLKNEVSHIRNRFHVRRIGVFGSFARGGETAESDVDILVEFEQDHVTFDNYAELKFHLEYLFKREVDLVTEEALRPQMKDSILREVTYA